MKGAEFASMLCSSFPELALLASERLAYFEEEQPGSYILFEQILIPAIDAAAETGSPGLKRLMDFVEEIAAHHDRDLVMIGLGEWLPGSPNVSTIIAVAGTETRNAIWLAERERIRRQRASESSPILSFLAKFIVGRRGQ